MEEPEDREDPEIEMAEPELQPPQKKVKQEKKEPARKSPRKKGKWCKKCGNVFNPNQTEGSKQPCHYHPGMSTTFGHSILH